MYGGVLFPDFFSSFGNPFYTLGDRYEVRLACVRAHNDYVVEEFCAGAPGRYIPLALLPVWSVEDSVQEVHRAAKIGHKGVCWGGSMDIFGMPWVGDPHWDPLWAAIQETDVVLAQSDANAVTSKNARQRSAAGLLYERRSLQLFVA